MKIADRMKQRFEQIGRPATPTEIAKEMDVSADTVRTTANRASWPKTDAGAYWPPDLTPFLLDDAEAEMINALRSGDRRPYSLTEREAAVIDAMRHA